VQKKRRQKSHAWAPLRVDCQICTMYSTYFLVMFEEVWFGEQVYVFLDEANTVCLQINVAEHLHKSLNTVYIMLHLYYSI
jgi:hypothetical protein